MTIKEIFTEISGQQLRGMMLHNDMANYFDFLGLPGFKRLHEYQFFSEAMEHRKTDRYFINHFGELLPESENKIENYIPGAWYATDRQNVDSDARKNAVKENFVAWIEFETGAKKLYEKCYAEAMNAGEAAASGYIMRIVSDVDMELKKAERMELELKAIDYDMPTVVQLQEELHEKYKRKAKKEGWGTC
jgi:hypothetical protein